MKSEKDIMWQYIKQNYFQFYNSLSSLEKTLYLMRLEKTISFRLYVLKSRIRESFWLIIGGLRNKCIR